MGTETCNLLPVKTSLFTPADKPFDVIVDTSMKLCILKLLVILSCLLLMVLKGYGTQKSKLKTLET